MARFWMRVDKGGHRSRPRWTLHTAGADGSRSLCGLAYRTTTHRDEATFTTALQGEKHVCRLCARKETPNA